VVFARDLGLGTGLSVVVLAESGARDDPFWMRGACLLTRQLRSGGDGPGSCLRWHWSVERRS
jgi:hypothetical protein